jgi:hypothetical protein
MKVVLRKEMPRRDMTISGDPNPDNSSSGSDDDIEDDTYGSSAFTLSSPSWKRVG